MRFLIDVCVGKSVGEWLKTLGHHIISVRDRNPRMHDEGILAWANDNRILITIDKDFGYYIFHKGQPHSGMIQLPNVPREKRLKLVKKVLELHSSNLEAGAIITVTFSRIKIRKV